MPFPIFLTIIFIQMLVDHLYWRIFDCHILRPAPNFSPFSRRKLLSNGIQQGSQYTGTIGNEEIISCAFK